MDAVNCGRIEVMVIGDDAQADELFSMLTERGHPVYMRVLSSAGAYTQRQPSVAFLVEHPELGLWDAVDQLHDLWPQTALVVVSDHITIELEDQAALRSFVALRLKTNNLEEFHALAHDLLQPRSDPQPLALEA